MLPLLSVLRQGFCCCWFIVYCWSHCLLGFVLGPRFVMLYLGSTLGGLQSTRWGWEISLKRNDWLLAATASSQSLRFILSLRMNTNDNLEAWLLYFNYLPVVMWLFASLPYSAVIWYTVSDCGVYWSYSLTFWSYFVYYNQNWSAHLCKLLSYN